MSLTTLFERLGAPLANNRWSWGAQRRTDGAVFLRVWQDEKRFENGRQLTILNKRIDETKPARNHGYQERQGHIAAVRAGAPCYLVMCIARDVTAKPRQVQSFIEDSVFLGGELIERDGDLWVEVVKRKPFGEVLPS